MAAVMPVRAIRGGGTPEILWQPWLRACGLPSLPLEHWLPPTTRLVVVAPHPDDEVLACGGLLHLHAARGGACMVVALTDGEASHADVAGWDSAALAAQRRDESRAGLSHLADACEVVRLGLPDGRLGAFTAKLADALLALLRPGDFVVSTWQLDGHPDHEACGKVAARLCARIGCRLVQAPVWMWHWAVPGDCYIPWHRLLALEMPAAVVARKCHALRQHASQLQVRGEGQAPILGAHIVARAARGTEYFFV